MKYDASLLNISEVMVDTIFVYLPSPYHGGMKISSLNFVTFLGEIVRCSEHTLSNARPFYPYHFSNLLDTEINREEKYRTN